MKDAEDGVEQLACDRAQGPHPHGGLKARVLVAWGNAPGRGTRKISGLKASAKTFPVKTLRSVTKIFCEKPQQNPLSSPKMTHLLDSMRHRT